MSMSSNLLDRVYHQEDDVIDDINRAVAFTALPALAAVIQSESKRLMRKYSPTEDDPFSMDALQSLILSQIASFLTYGDVDQAEVVQPHMLGGVYAEFYFDVQPEVKN